MKKTLMPILVLAILLTVFVPTAVRAANAQDEENFIPVMRMYDTFVTPVDPERVAYFFRALPKYYPAMSKSHRKFNIVGSEQLLQEGTLIDVEDKVGGQYLKQHLRVVKIENNRYFLMISESSTLKIGGAFRVPVKTILEYTIQLEPDDQTQVATKLTIEYSNDVTKLAAWLFGTKGIWRAHVREEMENARKIMESEQFGLDYQEAKYWGRI